MSKYIIGNTSSLPEISSPPTNGTSNSSFVGSLLQKPWTIVLYVLVLILVINIVVFLLRHYTSLLDYPIFDKLFSLFPWLKK